MVPQLGSRPFQLYLLYLYETYRKPDMARHVKYPISFEHCRMLIHPDIQDLAEGGGEGEGSGEVGSGNERDEEKKGTPDYLTPFARSMGDVGFRDTLHQEQFNNWRWRQVLVYGKGAKGVGVDEDNDEDDGAEGGDDDGDKGDGEPTGTVTTDTVQ